MIKFTWSFYGADGMVRVLDTHRGMALLGALDCCFGKSEEGHPKGSLEEMK
jgi:hypothetical protein